MFRLNLSNKGFGLISRLKPQHLQSNRLYSSSNKKSEPRIRYLAYMFVLSSALVYFGTKQVNRKRVKKSFGSEQELNEYEQLTGIRRRTRLITDNTKYKFYSVPHVEDENLISCLSDKLAPTKVKIIDPQQLVEIERQDESRRYSILLNDLHKNNEPLPTGLITALVKAEIGLYINTSQGIYDTNFILKNYPKNTSEASKFETDIASIEKVFGLKNEITDVKGTAKDVRNLHNVVSYFETVGKSDLVDDVKDIQV